MENTEQQMIDVARQGKAEGYKYLMGRYGRQIQLLVAQMVPDARDVEELTQDAFVRAFEHLQDFNPRRASFATWLTSSELMSIANTSQPCRHSSRAT